ncbi:hypothetical protein HK100_005887 [Physocladia obscura]|uniref:endo-polygalacturonase n=1 Tax=Physocladia obscura TaxID=109957 RepID=A0AAD5STN0_9FUNG|nr:hypothetical protein HK100_005887 [Physocladia obscura]
MRSEIITNFAIAILVTACGTNAASTTSTKTKTTKTTTTKVSTTTTPTNCIFTTYSDFSSYKTCSNILIQGPITVPAGSLIDLSKLATGATVTVSGNITFPHSSALTHSDFLITVGGAGITFQGDSSNPAILDGSGAGYWDGQGSNGGVAKPKFFSLKTTATSVIKNIKIVNAPVQCFSISASDTTLDSITIDDSAGDALTSTGITYAHNTDAFDVSGTNVAIINSWVHNQDDCLAIKTGTGFNFFNNTCIGGHGISIGSIGSGDIVSTVLVKNCTVENSLNGIRIKTDAGASGGSVKNVIYEDIILKNIVKATNSTDPPAMGICVRQDYNNGNPTLDPSGTIPISNLTVTNIVGTVTSNSFGTAYSTFILCTPGECSDFTFSGINITPVHTNCTNISPLPTVYRAYGAAGGVLREVDSKYYTFAAWSGDLNNLEMIGRMDGNAKWD